MKKKNVNKLLALGLVSAMTAGMLAGCGNTASTTTDNGAADTTVTEAADDKTSTDTAKADNGEVDVYKRQVLSRSVRISALEKHRTYRPF